MNDDVFWCLKWCVIVLFFVFAGCEMKSYMTTENKNNTLNMQYKKDQNGFCYANAIVVNSLSNIPYTYIPCDVLIEKGITFN